MMNLKMALLNQLRKRITDPANRATTNTETFSGDDSETDFQLSNANLSYISSVSIGAVEQRLISDYKIDFGTGGVAGKIKFNSAPATGTDNISVTYFTGSNWIYDDDAHTQAEMPRISLSNVGGSGEQSGGVGDEIILLKPSFRLEIYVRTGKNYIISSENYSGSKLIDFMMTDVQDQIRQIRKNNDIGGLIDIVATDPNYNGLDEAHKIKREYCTIRVNYMKTY